MTLTEKQTKQAQDLIEKYGFCNLETQKELAEAGFFEKVKVNFSIRILNSLSMNQVELCLTTTPDSLEIFNVLPMPQMGEVWKELLKADSEEIRKSSEFYNLTLTDGGIDFGKFSIPFTSVGGKITISETEAMCQLWLKLHKEGLL